MKTRHEDDGTWIVSLERGDDVRSCVETLAREQVITAARVTAIGALKDAELGAYVLEKKDYVRKTFPGICELVSLSGNITLRDGRPILHAHVIISGEDFVAHGGHLFNATSGLVVEMFIVPLTTPLARVMNDEIGLARWEPLGVTP